PGRRTRPALGILTKIPSDGQAVVGRPDTAAALLAPARPALPTRPSVYHPPRRLLQLTEWPILGVETEVTGVQDLDAGLVIAIDRRDGVGTPRGCGVGCVGEP